ncbi:hypothetical protein BDB01DRAFT_777374 [Pilobolus umbonatus]|nr:hypothetical protein BDB01DRAFT_777374 [Pilobolus umbonatus]
MTEYTNDNNNCFGLNFLALTSEDEDDQYAMYDNEEEDYCNWVDDSECQENLATIFSLSPEQCVIDSDNHIRNVDGQKLFFEELGYLCEEPEPIDPTRDYEAEAKHLIEERNKTRRMHVDLTSMPSLDETCSGLSSNSSSFHCHDDKIQLEDIRSLATNMDYQHKPAEYQYASYNNTLHPSEV